MIKQVLATAALVLALGVVSAAPAAADSTGGDSGAKQSSGSRALHRDGPPEGACIAVPVKANIQQLIGLINVISIQDIPILSAPQNQQCTGASVQVNGDEPISHILDDIPILSSNGLGNG